MKKKVRVIERENKECLERSLKDAFDTQLHRLRSLKTATKKRRALEREANRSVPMQSSRSMGGDRTQRSA